MEFQLFQNYIAQKCGIEITEEKAYLIETRLSKFLADFGLSTFGELYSKIRSSDDASLNEKIIDAITTNETLWFRDKTPWNILRELYLPKAIELLQSQKKEKIRIWSAAASTGQEAYSTAICIEEYLKQNNIAGVSLDNFEILATDISDAVIKIAKNGKYDAISVTRGLDKNIKEKYFIKKDMIWELSPLIKERVKFTKFNLQNSFYMFGNFDVIFCRYVLIYFSHTFKEDMLKKLSYSLADDGMLFLGSYETYEELNNYFISALHGGGVYYTKKPQRGT